MYRQRSYIFLLRETCCAFPRYPRYLTDLGHFNYFLYDCDIKRYIASSGHMIFDSFTDRTHLFDRYVTSDSLIAILVCKLVAINKKKKKYKNNIILSCVCVFMRCK